MKKKIAAVCLAAGQGRRMESKIQKQYLLIEDKPVLYYSLRAFQESAVQEVILVTQAGEEEYCRKEIVEKYGFSKVRSVIPGGKERYHSVYCGLQKAEDTDYVLIHDGARPFLTQEIIDRCIEGAEKYAACVAGMPVKDTIKLADEEQNIEKTLQRSKVWSIQTPQAFQTKTIRKAYDMLMDMEEQGKKTDIPITDDAMVAEYFLKQKVHLVFGSYDNIKITTPEDMEIAKVLVRRMSEK